MFTFSGSNGDTPSLTISNPRELIVAGIRIALSIALTPVAPTAGLTLAATSLSDMWKGVTLSRDLASQVCQVAIEAYFQAFTAGCREHLTLQVGDQVKVITALRSAPAPFSGAYTLADVSVYPLTESRLIKELEAAIRSGLADARVEDAKVSRAIETARANYSLILGRLLFERRAELGAFRDWYATLHQSSHESAFTSSAIHSITAYARQVFKEPLPIARGTPFADLFTLSHLYIEPLASIQNALVGAVGATDVRRITEHGLRIVDLPFPSIVHGQPGHGKTCFARVLCNCILDVRPDLLPILVEFGSIPRALPFLDFLRSRFGPDISYELLARRRCVLILDGMDEVQAVDGALGFVDTFRQVNRFVSEVNRLAGHISMSAVFTGRTSFIDIYRTVFPPECVLVNIHDLNNSDQAQWIEQFNRLVRASVSRTVSLDQLREQGLGELVGQPVLLTMMALMGVEGEGLRALASPSLPLDRAHVYERIVEWTYNRKWGEGSGNSLAFHIPDLEAYYAVLQLVALTIFVEGERTATLDQLLTAFEGTQIQGALRSIGLRELLERTRISFHFKSQEGSAYEFAHKSIEDFLVARACEAMLKDWLQVQRADDSWPNSRIVSAAAAMFARRAIERHHVEFLELLFARWSSGHRRSVFRIVEELWWQYSRDYSAFGDGVRFRGITQHAQAVNIGAALLHLITALHRVQQRDRGPGKAVELWSMRNDSASNLGCFVDFVESSGQGRFSALGIAFNYIDLNGVQLQRRNLAGIDVRDSCLREANLAGCDLSYSKLERADLSRANLSGARLEGVNVWRLEGSDIILSEGREAFRSLGQPPRTIESRGAYVRNVIYAEDESVTAQAVCKYLRGAAFEVVWCASTSAACNAIRVSPDIRCVITELSIQGEGGLRIIAESKRLHPEVPVIVLTARGDVRMAVQAIKVGAFDVLLKPVDQAGLVDAVNRACLEG